MNGDAGARKLGVGVIGTGWIGRRHAEALSKRADAEVRALCDLSPELAAEVAADTGGEVYSSWRQLLDEAAIDAVFVCTPPRAHIEPAVAALRKGVPLYLEKPIARDLPAASAIVSAAAESGTVCAVGYQWHAIDALDDVRRVLDGRPVGCAMRGEHRWDGVTGVVSRPCGRRREPARAREPSH